MKMLRRIGLLSCGTTFLWICTPMMVSVATFACYVLVTHGILTSSRAFTALSLFNLLQMPMSALPNLVSSVVEARVALHRLHTFLCSEELDPLAVERIPMPTDGKITEIVMIENGGFMWETPPRPSSLSMIDSSFATSPVVPLLGRLQDIHFSVRTGELVSIVGHVGAGKSSLLAALLGEIPKLHGRVLVRGRVAYVPQHAWMLNATIRENILFGRPMHAEHYALCLTACALDADLLALPAGDLTEIGEKGINLSGGQKQRVSLARALFSDADVYLLDDPLSAVDAHVGCHLFDRVIGPQGLLKNRTRILVTHHLHFLAQSHQIIVLRAGRILENGTYSALLQQHGEFYRLIQNFGDKQDNDRMNAAAFKEMAKNVVDDLQMRGKEAKERKTEDKREIDDVVHEKDSRKEKMPLPLTTATIVLDYPMNAPDDEKTRGIALLSSNQAIAHDAVAPVTASLSMIPSVMPAMTASIIAMPTNNNTTMGTLVHREESLTGRVDNTIYYDYARATGLFALVGLLLACVFAQSASLGANLWLSAWSSNEALDASVAQRSVHWYLFVYASLVACQSVLVVIQAFLIFVVCGVRSAAQLHSRMLSCMIRAPMSFFDTTPIGRILNRFSKDIYTVDEVLPRAFQSYFRMFFLVVSIVFVIGYSTPLFLLVVLPLVFVYYGIQEFYLSSSRELKRLDSTTRSPIYAHFSETLSGVSTLRAYAQQRRFCVENACRLDENQRPYYLSIAANRWLAMRLELLGATVVLCSALFAVYGRHQLKPGLVGLSLTYALSLTQALNWLVRQSCEIETNIIAVQRLRDYSHLTVEAPAKMPTISLSEEWPTLGEITFRCFSLRYRSDSPRVLNDLSFTIHGREKLGICGRTGAGKSSLALALFRLVEADAGEIFIDGIVISTLGLDDLRSRLSILPQDPVLFAGTVRENLDPLGTISDERLWKALISAHLDEHINALPGRLDAIVTQGGDNFSAGQRQLLSLARALLRNTRILILDEATAAVDVETDALVQATLRREFAQYTVITIAHRLNTIMDCDRILVLDGGRVAELDRPETLLKNTQSLFYQMAHDARLV